MYRVTMSSSQIQDAIVGLVVFPSTWSIHSGGWTPHTPFVAFTKANGGGTITTKAASTIVAHPSSRMG